jgi:phosphoribosylformylglycinamidine synthase
MEPFEIMISESQERMLCVVEPERLGDVLAICEHWEVRASEIGRVTEGESLRVFAGDELVGDVPVAALVDDCPLYDLSPEKPAEVVYPAPRVLLEDDDPREALLALIGSPNLSSRRPLFEQYDPIVQSRTVRRPDEADAAVLQLAPDGGRGAIAVSIDGNGRRVACDPYGGALEAVLECASNLACVGAEPLGLTNCLNFGNPEKPHIAWQLSEAVRGLAEGCRALDVPVVGGNVSLYNEGPEGPIYPTPIVGMVGRLPDPARAGRLGFALEGDVVAICGEFDPQLPGGELWKLRGEGLPDRLAAVDPAKIRAAQEAVRDAVRGGELTSAHDIAEGGFLVAVAECCLAGGIGAALDLGPSDDPLRHLFGEGPGGFVVSGPRQALERLAEGTPLDIFGTVGGEALEVTIAGETFGATLDELEAAHGRLTPAFA